MYRRDQGVKSRDQGAWSDSFGCPLFLPLNPNKVLSLVQNIFMKTTAPARILRTSCQIILVDPGSRYACAVPAKSGVKPMAAANKT